MLVPRRVSCSVFSQLVPLSVPFLLVGIISSSEECFFTSFVPPAYLPDRLGRRASMFFGNAILV
jgi:hypothetical protein